MSRAHQQSARFRVTIICLAAAVATAIQTTIVARAWNSDAPVTDAIDYRIAMFAPMRGLLAGLNPYSPESVEYLRNFGDGFAASLHTPSLVVLSAPATLLPFKTGYFVWVIASCLMLWGGIYLATKPRTARQLVLCVVAGYVITLSGPGDEIMRLGQVTALAVLGLGLLMRYPKSWPGAIGIVLLATTPQFAIPLSILCLGFGLWRVVAWGWGITVALSVVELAIAVKSSGFFAFVQGAIANFRSADGDVNAINRLDLLGRVHARGIAVILVVLIVTAGIALAIWWLNLPFGPTTLLACVCFCLLAYFAMPYSLPLALLTGAAVLRANWPWRWVEWLVITMAAIAIPSTIVIAVPLAQAVGVSVGQVWFVFTLLEAVILLTILVVASLRIGQSVKLDRELDAGGRDLVSA